MPKCEEILAQVLERNGLEVPDQTPLYTYRVTAEELDVLQIELSNRFEIAGTLKTQAEYAAFCLFGAEWFRRQYDSGVWAWHTIFDGLGVSREQQQGSLVQQRGVFTMEGLRWWQVDLIETHLSYRYLTTLVCQGGLPINTLRKSGAGISRYIKSCLQEHERFPTEPLEEITERYAHFVPTTLNNAEVRGLVGEMVWSIAKLREQSDDAISRGVSRFDYLEHEDPGWELALPLRVEESEAKELLISFLDVTKSQPFSHRKISVSTTLSLGQNEGRVTRHLRFPSSLSEEDFRHFMGFEADENLISRMTGFLQAGETRVPCINISMNHDGSSFRLNKLDTTSLTGAEAIQKTTLVLAVGGQEIKQVDLAGGEELPDSPWVFVDEEAGNLIGVGSVRPRNESVIVAIPNGCDVSLSPDASTIEKLAMQVAYRNLVRLSGEASFYMEDISFRVITRSEKDESFVYQLRGAQRKLGVGGSDVWIGMPSVYEVPVAENAFPSKIPQDRIEWRPVTGGEWKTLSVECLGDIVLRIQDGDETRFSTKTTILPYGFTYRIVPGKRKGEGRIKLRGMGEANIYPEPNELVDVTAVNTDDGHTINAKVRGKRPHLLNFRFIFQTGNHCVLSFVCPTESVEIINAVGQALPENEGVTLDRIDGLKLQMVKQTGSYPMIFNKELDHFVDYAYESNVKGLYELPLSYIRNHAEGVLSLSSKPDFAVNYEIRYESIRFKDLSRTIPGWKVSRFGRSLQRRETVRGSHANKDVVEFYVPYDVVRDLEGEKLAVTVTPLGQPKLEMPEESVTYKQPGSWIVDHSDYAPGYYLVVARRDSGECLRPIRFAVKPERINAIAESEPLEELQFDHVLNIHDMSERKESWDRFFNRLVEKQSHPGWQRATEIVEASYDVPVTTYEAYAALTRNLDAVARFGFMSPQNARLWHRFERLPFLWSLIPLSTWINTAEKTLRFLSDIYSKANFEQSKVEKEIKDKIDLFAKEAPNRNPSMVCVVAALWSAGFEFDSRHLRMIGPNQIEGLTLQDRQQELSRRIDQGRSRGWPVFEIQTSDEVMDIFWSTPDLNLDVAILNANVLNGPAIAAIHSVYDIGVSESQIRQFKWLRALDPDWYDKANAVATFILMQRRLNENPDAFKCNKEQLTT